MLVGVLNTCGQLRHFRLAQVRKLFSQAFLALGRQSNDSIANHDFLFSLRSWRLDRGTARPCTDLLRPDGSPGSSTDLNFKAPKEVQGVMNN
jgi:hypothetical protein